MKQKQKIIIGITSLLCGSSIIFLSLKDNNQDSKKNNLSLVKPKKEEKKEEEKKNKEEKKENEQKSFSLAKIIIAIVVFLVLAILIWLRQRLRQQIKTEKEEKNKTLHLINQLNQIDNFYDPQKVKNILNQKKDLKCCVSACYFLTGIQIVFLQKPDDIKNADEQIMNEFLNIDILKKPKLQNNEEFYSEALIEKFKNILQAMINYLRTYLTSQLLEDVYQDKENSYNFLTNMAKTFIEDPKKDKIDIHTEQLAIKENEGQEANNYILENIKNNKYLDVLNTVIQSNQPIFIDNNGSQHFLFLKLFKFYKFINKFHNSLCSFFGKHNDQEKYRNQLTSCQSSKEALDKLFLEN